MSDIANIKTKICIPVRQSDLSKTYINYWPANIEINIFVSNSNRLNVINSDTINLQRNINIHVCDEGDNAGLLKQAIINWCTKNQVDYCIMLNEDVKSFSAHGYDIEKSIDKINHIMLALPSKCIGIVPYKTATLYNNFDCPLTISNCTPFLAFTPTQAIILDIKKCVENKLNFNSDASVGISYSAFYSDVLAAGLCLYTTLDITYLADDEFSLDIRLLHSKKQDIESKFLSKALKCKKYVNKLVFGIYLKQQYSSIYKMLLTKLEFDNEYFYNILVQDRVNNIQVIDCFKRCTNQYEKQKKENKQM